MSADPDKSAACPIDDKVTAFAESNPSPPDLKKKTRSVRFPNENQLVTEYFEPANPWRDGKSFRILQSKITTDKMGVVVEKVIIFWQGFNIFTVFRLIPLFLHSRDRFTVIML